MNWATEKSIVRGGMPICSFKVSTGRLADHLKHNQNPIPGSSRHAIGAALVLFIRPPCLRSWEEDAGALPRQDAKRRARAAFLSLQSACPPWT